MQVLFINKFFSHRENAQGYQLLMFRPSSESCIDIQAVLNHNPVHVIQNILPIYALSGCDTVSSLFGVGKSKLAKVVAKKPDLATKLEIFLDPHAKDEDLFTNGMQILASLFVPPYKKSTKFNALRPL